MRVVLLAFLLAVCAMPVGAQDSPPPETVALGSPAYRKALEEDTFRLINQYREAQKMAPFVWNPAIAKVARGHSAEMASGDVDFGHDGFSKRVNKLKDEVPGLHGAGENVLRTNDPNRVAQTAVQLWLQSPHHLANIRGDFNLSGMGIWVDDKGMIYFTQIFVKTLPKVEPAPTPPPPVVVSPFGFTIGPNTPARK